MNMMTYAYGEDNVPFTQQPYLLAENNTEEDNFINEKDIIVNIDEFDKELYEKDSRKEIVNKKKKGSHSIDLAFEYIKKGKKYEARNMLSDLYFTETDYDERKKIKAELDKLNAELVFSPLPSPDAIFHNVSQGDSLIKIASKYNTTYKSIMRINNKSRTIVKIGERLKVLNGRLSLLVDKKDFTLTVLLNGHYIKQYPIGIGMYDKTPEGVFVVNNKVKNPVWYSPEGVFPFGDPKNVLGTRWIGFEEKEGLYGYGIHGTTEPESIGKAMSNGCIRLRNEDVEELYDFVKKNTNVVIQK